MWVCTEVPSAVSFIRPLFVPTHTFTFTYNKTGRVGKIVKSVTESITGPIIDSTTTAWDGTLCSPGGFPCFTNKITLTYNKRFAALRMW